MAAAGSQPAWLLPPPSAEAPKLGIIEDSMSAAERLFHYTFATGNNDVHFLEYRMLHRLNIFGLQNRLAELKGSFRTKHEVSNTDLLELKNTLHDYSKHLDIVFFMSEIFWNR